jgi:hypothetical protein
MNETIKHGTGSSGFDQEKLLRDLHLAVCGDEDLGVKGLVKDVAELKSWRRKFDLRAAKVSGLVCGVFIILDRAWEFFSSNFSNLHPK